MVMTGPAAGTSRYRHAVSPQDSTTRVEPSSPHARSVSHVGPNRSSTAIGGSTRTGAPPSNGRRQTPRSALVLRSTRLSTIEPPSVASRPFRMTSVDEPTDQAHPLATSISDSSERRPSSVPASTLPPDGPVANDSAARSSPRGEIDPAPTDNRCPTYVPSTSVGSRRNHVPIASALGTGGPAHPGGRHEDGGAPAVVEAIAATAASAATPGPSRRNHRVSMLEGLRPAG